jgi:hypothetical protein
VKKRGGLINRPGPIPTSVSTLVALLLSCAGRMGHRWMANYFFLSQRSREDGSVGGLGGTTALESYGGEDGETGTGISSG